MTPLDWIASPAVLVEKNRLPAPRIYRPSEIFFACSSFPTEARWAITGNADETASAKPRHSISLSALPAWRIQVRPIEPRAENRKKRCTMPRSMVKNAEFRLQNIDTALAKL
jgi:hypothetical protein